MYNYIIMTNKKCMSLEKTKITKKAKTVLMSWLYL